MELPGIFYNPDSRIWYLFGDETALIEVPCNDPAGAIPALKEICNAVTGKGMFAHGCISYQAAPVFDRAMSVPGIAIMPLLSFRLYRRAKKIRAASMSRNFLSDSCGDLLHRITWEGITRDAYDRCFTRVKRELESGNSYQVNLTARFLSREIKAVRQRIQKCFRSPDGYFSCYHTRDFELFSFSPELFFEKNGTIIHSKPMKGTAPRGKDKAEDIRYRKDLENSEKNRAENLMIVDMIRNDMGRIAVPGSVGVEGLYTVESYSCVHQMITHVRAQTHANVCGIIGALFPCASVTGAPRIKTMEIISGLEESPRDIYTGSIGVLFPNGDALFNVAIRTLWRHRGRNSSPFYYGAGGGIVWDSCPDDEWRELVLKMGVVS